MVSVRTYVTSVRTKHTYQRVEPFFKLVLWLVLGRGSLYDSSLVIIFFQGTRQLLKSHTAVLPLAVKLPQLHLKWKRTFCAYLKIPHFHAHYNLIYSHQFLCKNSAPGKSYNHIHLPGHGQLGGHYFHTWCSSFTKTRKRATTQNARYNGRHENLIGRGLVGHLKFARLIVYVRLCFSLLETLNDRMLQLKHQRKANKHIADKLKELEAKVAEMENGELILKPAEYLMKNYSSADVDERHPNLDEGIPGEESSEGPSAAVSVSISIPCSSASNASSEVEDTGDAILNPPDIIAQGVRRSRVIPEGGDDDTSSRRDSEVLENSEEKIILPDHLQSLVEAAMRSLEEQIQ